MEYEWYKLGTTTRVAIEGKYVNEVKGANVVVESKDEKYLSQIIIKSIGGTNLGISVSFLIAGTACGLTGTLIGLPVGVLCALNSNYLIIFLENLVNVFSKVIYIAGGNSASNYQAMHLLNPAYYLTEIPVSIPFGELFLISSSVILLSFVVSVIPAIKAGKERPLETFRKA